MTAVLALFLVASAQTGQIPQENPKQARGVASHPVAGQGNGAAGAKEKTDKGTPPPPSGNTREKLSDAERITRLRRGIEADRKQVEDLKAQLADPESEYHEAEAKFKRADDRLQEIKKGLQKPGEAPSKADVDRVEAWWQSARMRFDLAIEARKARQEKVANLLRKIEQDQQALDQLTGAVEPDPKSANPGSPQTGGPSAVAPVGTADPLPHPAAAAGAHPPAGNGAQPAHGAPNESDAELLVARKEAQARELAARAARGTAQSLTARIEALRKTIDVEQKLLATARKRADQAHQARTRLEQDLTKKLAENAPAEQLQKMSTWIAGNTKRGLEAQEDIRAGTDRLQELQAELANLQAEHMLALQAAKQKQDEARAAEERVAQLQNPFALHNILQWLANHGPKLLIILLGILALQRLVKLSSRQIVRVMTRGGGKQRGTVQDQENRAETLVSVFRNTASLGILGGGLLMLLDEVGIPILPLMGGAAVLGLAVAFGAQNLIRDYFSGFMVLLEDQYGINDVVRIGNVSGLVENITLRMTVLRDLEGVVHFIPHGTITTVSNLTHGWSRALFDIGIAYKEDPGRVMDVLEALGKELREAPDFAPLILEDPEMLGVESLGDSAVVIRFFIKTRPLKQWVVKRELLRRIKNRFDQLGIEIPFPHRTVYHRHEDGGQRASAAGGPGMAA